MKETEFFAKVAAGSAMAVTAHQRQLAHSVQSVLKGAGLGVRLPLPAGVVEIEHYPDEAWRAIYKSAELQRGFMLRGQPAIEAAIEILQKDFDGWVESIEAQGAEPELEPLELVRKRLSENGTRE